MLNILHRQTTAYHPEANGAFERLHLRLKDALCAGTTAATWAEEIPWVLLGLFWYPLVLPNEFLQAEEFSIDQISKKFQKS